MGLRLRIFLGMMTVVVCALLATGFVAYRYGADAERSYNAQRLLRKEAALQRSLSYILEQVGGQVSQDSLALVFTDRICELSDVHSLTFSLYNGSGRLVTTSGPRLGERHEVGLRLNKTVLQSALGGRGRTATNHLGGGTDVVWPLVAADGSVLALGHVHYDPREAEEADWRAFLRRLAPVYLMLFVLVGVLAFSLSNSIVGPLKRLSADMGTNPLRRRQTAHAPGLSYRWKDEIGSLVTSYNTLLLQLQESMEAHAMLEREGAWREMAQQVAHEIKNPLTPLKLGAQHLQKAWLDEAPDFDKRLQGYVRTTVQQIEALSNIAEGFAMLASDGVSNPVVLDLKQVLKDTVQFFAPHGVELEVSGEGPFTVMGDPTRMTRALNNLVQNALESKGSSEADVVVVLRKRGGCIEAGIRDNGDGIEPDRISRIFEPKFTTKTHGLGLGLAMVRAIVQGAGGEVTVESTPGEGSVFWVCLPFFQLEQDGSTA
jgi:two-component system, NtrC family, nitrogen regulation sensor histidine kinase NtrY